MRWDGGDPRREANCREGGNDDGTQNVEAWRREYRCVAMLDAPEGCVGILLELGQEVGHRLSLAASFQPDNLGTWARNLANL